MSYDIQTAGAAADGQPTIRVVVADDHPIVRAGIASELSRHSDVEVCGAAEDGNEALQLAQTIEPDVLVLDISMPGLPTMEVLHHLRTLPKPPRTLILTAYADPDYVVTMLRAGARGYLLKDEEPATITAAVRAVAHDETRLSPAVMTGLVDHTVKETGRPGLLNLSEREIEVLRLLAEGQDNQEIGAALGISERTVRFHLRNIYDKLGVRRRGEAIAWVARRRWGYLGL
jgi:DNA-binding NarL/FixJ family response regulator